MRNNNGVYLGNSLWDSLGVSLWDSLWDSLEVSLEGSLWDDLWVSMWEATGDPSLDIKGATTHETD